jgi:hypothetical protein
MPRCQSYRQAPDAVAGPSSRPLVLGASPVLGAPAGGRAVVAACATASDTRLHAAAVATFAASGCALRAVLYAPHRVVRCADSACWRCWGTASTPAALPGPAPASDAPTGRAARHTASAVDAATAAARSPAELVLVAERAGQGRDPNPSRRAAWRLQWGRAMPGRHRHWPYTHAHVDCLPKRCCPRGVSRPGFPRGRLRCCSAPRLKTLSECLR